MHGMNYVEVPLLVLLVVCVCVRACAREGESDK
jgi:hypothetical protein